MDSLTPHPIRTARRRKGLTQAELASAVGVSKASVSGWETGQNHPDIRHLARISAALKPHFKVLAFLREVSGDPAGQGRVA